jgi:KaiC/GvpD/RAD55 family RecA-like ATPase
LWQDALLIDESNLDTKNFLTKDGAYYFALAKNLRSKGFTSFDEVTVLSNISDELLLGFNERGGWTTIQVLIDVINNKNYETYLDILYRENIIIGMFDDGFNLLKEIDVNGKSIVPLNMFRKMDSESVLDWYESRLTTYGTGYSSKVLEEEEIDFDDEFIDNCAEGLENGVPFDIAGYDINNNQMNCFPFLSNQINGLLDRTFTMLGGYSSVGKSTIWITILMALMYRGRRVLIISNEESIKKFKIKFMIWLLAKYRRYFKLTKKKMTSGEISENDRKELKIVQQYWRENFKSKLKFIAIADADMNTVKKKIRENVLKYGYDTVLYDTFKLDFEDSNSKEYLSLIKDSRELDKLAKKYNIIMLASLQLAIHTLGKLFLDSSVLSMGKQIKEVLEGLMLMRTVYPEELDPENKKYYCKPFRLKKVNDKWIEEPYEPDQTATWRMLFVDKTRSGSNSSDTGVAYLLKFDGEHSIFREVAQCRPKHGYIQ